MSVMLMAPMLNALRTLTPEDGLEDIDLLEPDPKTHRKAMQHPRLAPFWLEAAVEEMEGLWRRGCFKKWRRFLRPGSREHGWKNPYVDGCSDGPEESPQIFIRPPAGWKEEPDVVYEVLRPLYGIPSSARALHYTLGCKLIRDRAAGTIKLVQGTYIRRILETHGMTDCHQVKTPLAPGVRLTRRDSPQGDGRRGNHVEQAGRCCRLEQTPWVG
mmetsp:Transcript_62304/g.129298  ORF Transcript_62304/g.129298 Transcript_62304/m.129298 type:complete len:214 (-) Transcript_62304:258-899(-)